ncbi:MAG: hypothetical protein M9899_07625 [Bdellovibrionaceae bacterium]|nr:hypothetical protein [Pseudobdellovibrionaceae bacterium]
MMKSKKAILLSMCVMVCLLFYQNCSTTSNIHQNQRTISLKSKVDIQILDDGGSPFLSWNFEPGNEVYLKISPRKGQFCQRSTYLRKDFETKWSNLISSLKPVRGSAATNTVKSIFKIKVDGYEISVRSEDAKQLLTLMEETKLNHQLSVTNCDKMAWSFNKITIETLATTPNQSKYLQVLKLRSLGGNAADVSLKEEPIDIKHNSKDAFCDYVYREYDNNFPMLSLMFAANEIKSLSENNSRGLASLKEVAEEAETVDSNLLVTIDGFRKVTIPANSELRASLSQFIRGVKASKRSKKSCGYAM